MLKRQEGEKEDCVENCESRETSLKRDVFFASELWKRSDILRKWNLRYFEVHRDGILRFFQDKQTRRLRGVFLLNLKGNRVSRADYADPRMIKIEGIGQKWTEHATAPRNILATSKSTLILRAVNLSTAARWIVSLNRFIFGHKYTQNDYTTNETLLAKRMYVVFSMFKLENQNHTLEFSFEY